MLPVDAPSIHPPKRKSKHNFAQFHSALISKWFIACAKYYLTRHAAGIRLRDMDILKDTKRILSRDKRSLQAIARESGIPFSTIRYIKIGRSIPRYDTLVRLHNFLVK